MNATPGTPIPSTTNERFALAVAACVSLASLAAMGALGIAVGWSQRRIAADFANVQPVAWLDSGAVSRGRDAFAATCTACHNEDGKGRPGLGRDLTSSAFVRAATDDRLARMIAEGRAADDPLNTTKVTMPPRGGNAAISDADLGDIVVYLRALQDPARVARGVSLVARSPAPTDAQIAAAADAALAAAGGDAELAEYIASGTRLYASSCIACHGAGGLGMKGNGKALVNNEFIQSLSDDDLLAFIKRGRDPSDPKNTTGVGMPAKGGNPALSDDDILDIVCYLRTLQPDKPVAATGK